MRNFSLFFCILFVMCSTLMAQGVQVSIAAYKGDKECAISYTFDDGLKEHYTLVAPEFEKRGFCATFFINGIKINSDTHIADTTRMTWSQLREMSDRGHEISNHGWAHKNFSRFPIDEIKEDVEKNDSAIFACTGKMPRTFCYPNNNKKAEGRRVSDKNRVGTRTFQRSLGSKSNARELEEWTQKMIETHDWGVTMTHGLTYGYDCFGNPQRLWEHLDKVKKLEDKIWVGTFCEVASYIAQRKATTLVAYSIGDDIAVVPYSRLDKDLFIEPLTMVVRGLPGDASSYVVSQNGKDLEVTFDENKLVFEFRPFDGKITIKR